MQFLQTAETHNNFGAREQLAQILLLTNEFMTVE